MTRNRAASTSSPEIGSHSKDRPQQLIRYNLLVTHTQTHYTCIQEVYNSTPSPSDSAVGDLENVLKEKDSEIVYLR